MSYAIDNDFAMDAEPSLTDQYQTTVLEIVGRALKHGERDKIHQHIKSTGEVTLTRAVDEEDPGFGRVLSILAQDIAHHPEGLQSFSSDLIQSVRALTKDVVYDVDAPLSPDDD